MTGTQWEHQPEVRDALRTIVADPEFGIGALSNPQPLSNLLKDLLPDAPKETSVLVAAAEAELAGVGHEGWHTLHNPAYQALRPGQFLECYTDPQVSGLFLYMWTLPSQRVILVAGDSAAGASYTALQDWWEKLTYG